MRLIDADAMRENLLWCKEQSSRYDNYWDDVIERLDVQPTVDAVPVVRCKDCRHCDEYSGICLMAEGSAPYGYEPEPGWFCADGERKIKMSLTIRDYFRSAKLTMNPKLTWEQTREHALRGMSAELGEVNGLYQKVYQGHELNIERVKEELGDLCWFIMELCYAEHIDPEEMLEYNIEKLNQRYPEGFDSERSRNRDV